MADLELSEEDELILDGAGGPAARRLRMTVSVMVPPSGVNEVKPLYNVT